MDKNGITSIAESFGGNPPVIETPIGAIAESIHQRIEAEELKLRAEGKNERDLTARCAALLTEGSDAEVDACELAIDQSRSGQLRSLKRIELLAEQLKQANRVAETQHLDKVTVTAEQARQRGLSVLKKYSKAAKAVADALAELRECEQTIAIANSELAKAKRPTGESADPKRFPVTAPNGFTLDVVGLIDIVNLPSDTADGSAYWQPRDVIAELAAYMIVSPNPTNRKLATS